MSRQSRGESITEQFVNHDGLVPTVRGEREITVAGCQVPASCVTGDGLIACFVYGTLRVGEGNYRWSAPAVVRSIQGVKATGRIYHVRPGYDMFPVANFGKPGEITGDILFYDAECEITEGVFGMEVGAGYLPKLVTVKANALTEIECLAFDYSHHPREQYGERIKGGDWLKRSARCR